MAKTFYFSLPDIFCVNCIVPVEAALRRLKKLKIEDCSTDVIKNRIAITVSDDEQDKNDEETGEIKPLNDEEISKLLKDTIEDTGVRCEPSHYQPKSLLSYLLKGCFGTLFGIGMIVLMLSGIGVPFAVMATLVGVSSLLTAYLGFDSYKDAIKMLVKSRTLTMETLFTVSTVTAVAMSIASLFIPGLPMMLEAGVLIFGFHHLGRALDRSLKRKISAKSTFRNYSIEEVEKQVQQSDNEIHYEKILVDDICENDIVKIKKGEIIPIDGTLISEKADIDDNILTGSIKPSPLKKGDAILAGVRVSGNADYILIKVTHTAAQSNLVKLDNQVFFANKEKAPLENITAKIMQYFVPGVLAFATISAMVIGALLNSALAIYNFASILVAVCPCSIGSVLPFAWKFGKDKAKEHHVEFKTSKAIQMAAKVDTIVFDLNGTLTQGIPVVNYHRIAAENKVSAQNFYKYLSAIEKNSTHPIAKAITQFANKCVKGENNLTASKLDLSHHSGIAAIVDGKACLVGNKKFMKEKKIDVSKFDKELEKNDAQQTIYLAADKKLMGYVTLKDPPKPEAKIVLAELKKINPKIEFHIATGADEETALRYAKLFNIPKECVLANCRNTDKADYIKHLKTQNKCIAMVGDGGNDTVALAASDMGVGVESTANHPVAQQEADALITSTSLLPLVSLFEVARETVHSIKQNLILSLAYNSTMMIITGGLLLALAGFSLNPAIGVAIMVVQASLLLLNQYRIRRQTLAHTKAAEQQLEKQKTPEVSSSYKTLHQYGVDLAPLPSTIKRPNTQGPKALTRTYSTPNLLPKVQNEAVRLRRTLSF